MSTVTVGVAPTVDTIFSRAVPRWVPRSATLVDTPLPVCAFDNVTLPNAPSVALIVATPLLRNDHDGRAVGDAGRGTRHRRGNPHVLFRQRRERDPVTGGGQLTDAAARYRGPRRRVVGLFQRRVERRRAADGRDVDAQQHVLPGAGRGDGTGYVGSGPARRRRQCCVAEDWA